MSGEALPGGLPGVPGPTGGDPQAFLDALVDAAARALPADRDDSTLEVERTRTLKDRLSGRPGAATQLRLNRPNDTLTLRLEQGRRLVGESAYVSGGVIISRRTLPLGEWLTVFAGEVAAIAADAAGDAASAAQALHVLGVKPAGSDLVVDETEVESSLRALPARSSGRIPDEAQSAVERIVALLADTLPRVAGGGESEVLVRRTATVYLPETIRAFLALPADWATGHVFADGSTASQILVQQLDTLETAATRMRDAAVEQDASALLVNGRFLSDRFAVSSLDLP